VTDLLQFIYTLAHAAGNGIVNLVQRIVPQAKIPVDLVDPIGFLAVLTVFVLLTGLARKIAWIIVIAGWVLIGVRVVLAILGR
jgi:hypothetical protein